jgi:hypothetical protein
MWFTNQSTPTMTFLGEYMYVIEETDVAELGRDIYKIEGSKLFINRIMQYPMGTVIHMVIKVNDIATAEKRIIEQLNSHSVVTHRKDIGCHYFQGSLGLIKNVITQTASPHDTPLQSGPDDNTDTADDPFLLINEYITHYKYDLEGKNLDAMSFYKIVSSEICLPGKFTYDKFVSVLRRHNIREQIMSYGPCFVFPPLRQDNDLLA